jgi:hypothetical protein
MPTERPPLVGEVVPTLADRGCCVVSATDPPGGMLGFLDRSRYYFFQVAPQLSSRGQGLRKHVDYVFIVFHDRNRVTIYIQGDTRRV